MGMSAIGIEPELRYSQLLARVGNELYPKAVENGMVTLSREQIFKICDLMAYELETFTLRDSLGNIQVRDAQWLISNTLKLVALLEWTFKNEDELCFA